MDFSIEKRLQGFKQIAQEKLQTILCSIPFHKDLIIEPALIKPLEHVCVASWVKSKGVQRIYKFDAKNSPPKHQNVHVYFISANLITFKHVLDQIHSNEERSGPPSPSDIKNYHVIVLPNVLSSFLVLLEEEGLYGVVRLHRFNWDLIYLDECLLSLELPQVFGEVFIQKDMSSAPSIAHSLRILNMIIGKPDLILTYGTASSKILDQITLLNRTPEKSRSSDFSAMIIVDRDKDYPSCLLTPAIYSGLLLEIFKYKSGELEIQRGKSKIASGKLEIFNLPTPESATTKKDPTSIRMNGTYDEIFAQNRYKHFAEASNSVRNQAKALGVEVQNLNKMKLNEMQTYVAQKLPKITEMKGKITKHLNACEHIIHDLGRTFQQQQSLEEDILNNTNRKQILAKIDELLTIDAHKLNTIRLMCLVHLSIGLTTEELSTFIRNYCNVFGHKYLFVFQSLAKANLLPWLEVKVGTKAKLLPNIQLAMMQQTTFQANANRLRLLNSTPDSKNSDLAKICPSYVFNGTYIPLVAQLCSFLLKSESFDDFASKVGTVEEIKISLGENEATTAKNLAPIIKRGEIADHFPLKKRILFVFVVGGVTYAEIAACNFVSRISSAKIVVASNRICSGSDIIADAFEIY